MPTFEVGRKAGLGEAVADTDDGIDPRVGRARPTSSRSTTNGASAPASTAISSRWCARWCRATWIRASASATWTSRIRASGSTPSSIRRTIRSGSRALLAPTTVRKGLDAASNFSPKIEAGARGTCDARTAGAADPLVAPPIYGCWHAQVERVSAAPGTPAGSTRSTSIRATARPPAWARASSAPTRRATSRIAWEQIGDVLTVNHKIRRAQLAIKAASFAYAKSAVTLPPERRRARLAGPAARCSEARRRCVRIVKASRVPRAALSVAFRKQLRPRGRLARNLLPADVGAGGLARIIAGISAGTHSAAPPRPPAGGATVEGVNADVSTTASSRANTGLLALLALVLLIVVLPLLVLAPAWNRRIRCGRPRDRGVVAPVARGAWRDRSVSLRRPCFRQRSSPRARSRPLRRAPNSPMSTPALKERSLRPPRRRRDRR